MRTFHGASSVIPVGTLCRRGRRDDHAADVGATKKNKRANPENKSFMAHSVAETGVATCGAREAAAGTAE